MAVLSRGSAGAAGGRRDHALGILGARVYDWQQADIFWEYLLAIIQGEVWPAFMVYQAFGALAE